MCFPGSQLCTLVRPLTLLLSRRSGHRPLTHRHAHMPRFPVMLYCIWICAASSSSKPRPNDGVFPGQMPPSMVVFCGFLRVRSLNALTRLTVIPVICLLTPYLSRLLHTYLLFRNILAQARKRKEMGQFPLVINQLIRLSGAHDSPCLAASDVIFIFLRYFFCIL